MKYLMSSIRTATASGTSIGTIWSALSLTFLTEVSCALNR